MCEEPLRVSIQEAEADARPLVKLLLNVLDVHFMLTNVRREHAEMPNDKGSTL